MQNTINISITMPTTEFVVRFSILQLKFVFSRVLEFGALFCSQVLVGITSVLHHSVLLPAVTCVIRRHYTTRSFDSISLNLALRFIFLLQILFACALCFIAFSIITGSILSLLSYVTIPLCVMTLALFTVTRYFVNRCFPLLERFRFSRLILSHFC